MIPIQDIQAAIIPAAKSMFANGVAWLRLVAVGCVVTSKEWGDHQRIAIGLEFDDHNFQPLIYRPMPNVGEIASFCDDVLCEAFFKAQAYVDKQKTRPEDPCVITLELAKVPT